MGKYGKKTGGYERLKDPKDISLKNRKKMIDRLYDYRLMRDKAGETAANYNRGSVDTGVQQAQIEKWFDELNLKWEDVKSGPAIIEEGVDYDFNFNTLAYAKGSVFKEKGKLQAAVKAAFGAEAMADVEFKKKFGAAKADIQAFLGAMNATDARIQYDWENLGAELFTRFFAGLEITCNGNLRAGTKGNNLDANLAGKAMVGVEAIASASIGLEDYSQFKAGLTLAGFAGAQATATGTSAVTIFGRKVINVAAIGTVRAGIGGELTAEVTAGIKEVGLDFAAGYTFGLGASTSYNVRVDINNTVMTGKELIERAKNIKATSQGYTSLSLVDKEWQLKAKTVQRECKRLVKEEEKKLSKIEKELKKLGWKGDVIEL